MAGYTTTYSGDLTTSLTSAIADQIFGIISDAKGQKKQRRKKQKNMVLMLNLTVESLLLERQEID